VDVIRGKKTWGPRAEDKESIMAMGIANSLSDALRTATTELARWLERDYRLTPNESGLLLGSFVSYEITNVVDPQVNVVAKIKKSVLAQVRR
jgi:amidase